MKRDKRCLFLYSIVVSSVSLLMMAPLRPAYADFNGPITRSEVIDRAWNWVNRAANGESFTYDMYRNSWSLKTDVDGLHKYGADCSGLVGMAWHLYVRSGDTGGPNTRGLADYYSFPISWSELKAGDILNDYSEHVILFDKWQSDGVHFTYFTFGSSPPRYRTASVNDAYIDGHPKSEYIPRRYNNIVDGSNGGSAIIPTIEYLLSY